ncbi:LPS export ABC transporter periplasmic protein LptC [Hydrogenothermus marinus]|uniref:LPS export ABC transporter protein LptC n=1 Tax=Hydrogenothermus marinus TaxID=133270 RepID=A0A3M0BGC4_9AQUI|nr:LPS export ABC transporter periplasmic protein LptC [Hydrogenothermus marinus]RMA96077.1 LPS export ABC transporter protein LptC [Hydrogenothermus marinus]
MKKIFIYMIFFLSSSVIFYFVSTKLEESKLKNITYKNSTIYNFTYVKKNSQKIIVKGEKLIDNQKNVLIQNMKAYINDKNKNIKISSEKAIYDKKDLLNLENNVNITTNDMVLNTDYLTVNFNKDIAYNFTDNKIFSKNMTISGKNLFFDIKKDLLKLEKVKTIIKEEKID